MLEKDVFINPIDDDNITENPSGITYPHHRGSSLIKPEDIGKVKSRAYMAMEQQTESQLKQIYQQIEVLAKQAQSIKNRVEISTLIYKAEMRFEPLIGKTYHLYQKNEAVFSLAVIGPEEWGKTCPYLSWIASAKLLADHTWEVVNQNDEVFDKIKLNFNQE